MWNFLKSKQGKGALHIALTALCVLLALAASLTLTALTRAGNLFLDMTDEGRYTVRARMVEILRTANIEQDVDIIFCADADRLLENYQASLVYIMCLELEKQVAGIHVSCIDIAENPEAVAPYKRTSATEIAWNDVIVVSGTEYRTYKMAAFFTVDSTTNNILGYNGEQKMCEAILSLTAKDLPLACFTVGNGEKLPTQSDPETGYFYDLIRSAGYEVVAIDLSREDIPESCSLLILNGPTADYPADRLEDLDYESPITKIDRFLDHYGSVFYFRNPDAPTLPNLEEFLREWGVSFSVTDPVGTPFEGTTLLDSSSALSGDPTRISGTYGDSTIYSDITALASPPKTVFERAAAMRVLWPLGSSGINSSGRTIQSLFTTGTAAQAVNAAGDTVTSGQFPLMTVTTETRVVNNEYYNARLVVCSTSLYTSAAYLADRVYANADVLESAVRGFGSTSVSIADELEFKYFSTPAFTETYDELDNTIYNRDENGDIIWVLDPSTGVEEASVIRIIRPIEDGERTALTVTLILTPALLSLGAGLFVILRRRAR